MLPLPIDHIGIAVTDLATAVALYRDSFGLTETHRETLSAEGIDVVFLEGAGPAVELIASENSDSALGRSLKSRGPGLHHICFRSDDIASELTRLATLGHRLIDQQPRQGARGKLIAFLHPKTSGGVLIEICQTKT